MYLNCQRSFRCRGTDTNGIRVLGDFNFHADSPDCTPAVDSFDCAGLLWSHLATVIYTHTHTHTCALEMSHCLRMSIWPHINMSCGWLHLSHSALMINEMQWRLRGCWFFIYMYFMLKGLCFQPVCDCRRACDDQTVLRRCRGDTEYRWWMWASHLNQIVELIVLFSCDFNLLTILWQTIGATHRLTALWSERKHCLIQVRRFMVQILRCSER